MQLKTTLTGFLIALATLANATDLNVPADYATIQDAVNAAASGDTIHIAPGVYVAQTWISNKNLTLIGQPGTILRAFPGMLAAIPGEIEWRCVLYIYQSSNVVVRDLTFEGDQLADQNVYGLVGAQFDLSGGSVENCRFTGFRERTPGSVSGHAIAFWNDYSGAPLFQAEVIGNIIEDSYTGIQIGGAPDTTSFNFLVADNTITGVGPNTANDGMVGISLLEGAVGTVARNTISGFSYIGDGSNRGGLRAFGILALSSDFPGNVVPLEPMTFERNVLRNNQVQFGLILGDDSVVTNNTFEGTALGANPAGLWFSGSNVQVVGNQFRDMPGGILLAGLGAAVGNAANAMLIDNRFCDVTTPINQQPQATATEQGTSLCPFPNPVLDIASAVLVCWPEVEEGFSVETAPTMDGPWTPSESSHFLENGSQCVAVPTSSDQQFFRLVKP